MSLNINREVPSTKAYSLPPQFGKEQPQAHDKRKLSILVILRPPHTATLSPMHLLFQS